MHRAAVPATLSRRLLLGSFATLAAAWALPGCAHPAADGGPPLASLEVVDRDNGQVLPVYHHQGRRYVPGRPGARYALRLRNQSSGRLLVVLSVDGINVISGQTADWGQTGYVLEPGRWHDITGWRKSDTQVAAFEFAPIEQSYAARTGRAGEVGVIGMAVFRERPLPPPPPAAPPVAMESAAPAPASNTAQVRREARERTADASAAAAAPAAKLGTGHGAREWSAITRTQFERAAAMPDQLLQIEYDRFERLVAAGVIRQPPPIAPRPLAFPGNTSYVPDPPR
ncbi:MAG: hypothetical protein LCI02_27920 [Proteobacteria bacterium]|nr:hypothetical protein [Pseudomonadota bacterium]